MNEKELQDAGSEKTPRPHRARIPGFNPDVEVGLGDVIKRATSLVGIKPCGQCRERAAALNSWLVFSGRR